jgi:hypothetical protein
MARSTVLFIMINLFHEYKRDKENPQVKSAKEGEFSHSLVVKTTTRFTESSRFGTTWTIIGAD